MSSLSLVQGSDLISGAGIGFAQLDDEVDEIEDNLAQADSEADSERFFHDYSLLNGGGNMAQTVNEFADKLTG